MEKHWRNSRRVRREDGAPVLILMALLLALPLIGLVSPRSRIAAEPPSVPNNPEHEPPPSPLVAPRPPVDDGQPSPAALPARETVWKAEDAERTPTGARPASPEHASANTLALVALEIRVSTAGRAAGAAFVELLHEPSEHADGAESARLLRQCDEYGVLALELAPGTLCALAWSADSTAAPAQVALVAGQAATLELALEPAFPVAGRVLDANTGAPIADACVSFWTYAEQDVVHTAADGTFVHPRFPARAPAQQIAARAAGYGLAVRYLRVNDDGRWKISAASAGEASVSGAGRPWVELALVPEQRVVGRVLDESGAPIAGAHVLAEGFFHALPSVASRDALEGLSDTQGRFTLAGLRSDISHALVLEAPGRARARLELAANVTVIDVGDLVLAGESVLAGVVIDADGQPLADVDVVLRVTGMESLVAVERLLDVGARLAGRELHARTGPEGTFVFAGLEPRNVTLSIQHELGDWQEELVPRPDGSFAAPCITLAPAAFAQR